MLGFIVTLDNASESFDKVNSVSGYDGTLDNASESLHTINSASESLTSSLEFIQMWYICIIFFIFGFGFIVDDL